MRQPLPFRRSTQRHVPRRPLLDADDRAALAQLASYALLLLAACLVLLTLAAVGGLCVRIFEVLS